MLVLQHPNSIRGIILHIGQTALGARISSHIGRDQRGGFETYGCDTGLN